MAQNKTLEEILQDAQSPIAIQTPVAPIGTATATMGVATAQAVSPPVIELSHVSKWYDVPTPQDKNARVEVVNDVSLVVEDSPNGEFIAILGPSGCGKSTLLNMLAGQTQPNTGTVKTFGQTVGNGDNPYAVTVQQAYTCFDWRDVLANVTLGLEIQGMAKKEREALAMHYLEKVGLADRAYAYPKELSGGMKQRVAIARALAMKPKLILMDEPFGALDANIREEMQQLVLNIWSEEKNTIVFITHDITEAVILADRILVMSPRPTSVVKDIIVPFGRPRTEDVTGQKDFVDFSHELLKILKNQDGGGQVRVSV
jgi:NitT/TauT family transport system ATP-binding protein